MEAIAEHDSRPKWFIGMVCTKEFGIFIFSGGVSFTKISLFQPDPYKNVRNPTQIVITSMEGNPLLFYNDFIQIKKKGRS